MNRFFTARGIRRLAVALAAAGVAGIAPVAALAYQGYGGTLPTNSGVCVQQYANSKVRGEGTATKQGAWFTLRYSGQYPGIGEVVSSSATTTTNGWAAEARPEFGNFRGKGYYQVCAVNVNSTSTLVNIRILVDGDFS
jgi:hypothetical protein